MKFRIYRTSDYENCPCDGAFKGIDSWFINIESLEELMKLIENVGDIIVSNSQKDPNIEIYDYYRE